VLALAWTAANLAVTASRTRALQMRDDRAGGKGQVRWLMIPWLF
jgi:hypothetical protein